MDKVITRLDKMLGKEYIPSKRWLYIETSNVCNLKCKFCAYPKISAEKQTMSNDLFINIVDQAISIGIDSFGLTPTVGDSFSDKRFISKLEYLENNPGVKEYRFTTNLIIPSEDSIKNLCNLDKLASLGISVYGHDKETFIKLTSSTHNVYERFINNLNVFLRSDISKIPKLRVGIRTSKDIRSLDQCGGDIGNALGKIKGKYPNTSINIREWFDNWGGIVSQSDVEGLNINISDSNEITKIGACSLIFHKNMITVDGRALACACRDVYGQLQIGDIKTQTLKESLMSGNSRYRELINEQQMGTFPEVCKSCSFYDSIYRPVEGGVSLDEFIAKTFKEDKS